jgi:hypothetical protein
MLQRQAVNLLAYGSRSLAASQMEVGITFKGASLTNAIKRTRKSV